MPALLFLTVEAVVDAIAAHHYLLFPNGHHIDALAGLQRQVPVVTGHTRNDVIVAQLPMLADITVLHPDIRVLLGEGNARDSILDEDAGMGLAVVVHDIALVAH